MNFIDVHAHLNFAAYDADREEVLKRAREGSVIHFNVGTQQDTAKKAVEIAETHDGVYAIIGVHPIHTDKSYHDEKELGVGSKEFTSRGEVFNYDYYKELAKSPKVVGIGECGLDYYRAEPEAEKKQREAFSSQIALANELGKALMLHVRSGSGKSAYLDALEILKAEAKVPANFHFFAGSIEEAQKILDAGHTMSFTGVITFAKEYASLIDYIPLDRMMTETDCPYVTPVPYRGKRNEPLYVVEVARKIAEVKKVPIETVRDTIFATAQRIFGI